MGDGRWSASTYHATSSARMDAGISHFAYSDSGARKVHDRLNPLNVTRESCDSDEHPRSVAVAVLCDVTGSMRGVPRIMQEKLVNLFGLLTDKGYAADPHVLFGAIGDATCDKVPLQIGQFESDNRADDDLSAFVLEGGGGGQETESYELAMYFMARHTKLDCFTKRGRRGYLFIIGDEMPYSQVSRDQVRRIIGDDLAETLSTEQLVEELLRMYHVYYILPVGSSYVGNTTILGAWRKLLGQNVIELDDLDAVCETIAIAVGLGEGSIDLDTGLTHLSDVGSTKSGVVGKALAPITKGVVAKGPALTVDRPDDDGGIERL